MAELTTLESKLGEVLACDGCPASDEEGQRECSATTPRPAATSSSRCMRTRGNRNGDARSSRASSTQERPHPRRGTECVKAEAVEMMRTYLIGETDALDGSSFSRWPRPVRSVTGRSSRAQRAGRHRRRGRARGLGRSDPRGSLPDVLKGSLELLPTKIPRDGQLGAAGRARRPGWAVTADSALAGTLAGEDVFQARHPIGEGVPETRVVRRAGGGVRSGARPGLITGASDDDPRALRRTRRPAPSSGSACCGSRS